MGTYFGKYQFFIIYILLSVIGYYFEVRNRKKSTYISIEVVVEVDFFIHMENIPILKLGA